MKNFSLVIIESSIAMPLDDLKHQSEPALFAKLNSFDVSNRLFPHKSKIFIIVVFCPRRTQAIQISL